MKINKNPYAATLYVWNCMSAFFFSSHLTPFHSHNTMQVVFDIRKKFKCRLHNGDWGLYKSIIIKENAIHQLDANGGVQLLIYLDAGTEMAKAINLKYLQQSDICSPGLDILDIVMPGQLEQCLIGPDIELLEKIVYQLLSALADRQKFVPADERVAAVLKLLATDNLERMTIGLLAGKVFLSESRLRSLFRQVTGVPLHRYIIWNRIMLAMTRILNGATIADAAIYCGFTDASHLHKLMLRMFGVRPSQFIKDNSRKSLQICHRYPLSLETRQHDEKSGDIEKVYKL
jgi:AraC-like DNA-binding protein